MGEINDQRLYRRGLKRPVRGSDDGRKELQQRRPPRATVQHLLAPMSNRTPPEDRPIQNLECELNNVEM